MQHQKFCLSLTLSIFAAALLAASASAASKETVLYSFTNRNHPFADLILDKAGNLYGTSPGGGLTCNQGLTCGLVFKLERGANGKWSETVLHTFGKGNDGREPYNGLVFDSSGNLYGVTAYGGNGPCRDTIDIGCGVIFELSPKTGGGWTENVLFNFGKPGDGTHPYADLILDADGNLYGTTSAGGARNKGTVFELSPQGGGVWGQKVLHSFVFNPKNRQDGSNPQAALVFDSSGNLYGTTYNGGPGKCRGGCGTVFELTLQSGGSWKETVLHSFDSNDPAGHGPLGGLIVDAAGNLYGTTQRGGAGGGGTVFELTPETGGGWMETVLHSFGASKDGEGSTAPVISDPAGNLYGTTFAGGAAKLGTVFELTKAGSSWTETVLHSFGIGLDGSEPFAGLVRDGSGNLFGTTVFGGTHDNSGTVFEITP